MGGSPFVRMLVERFLARYDVSGTSSGDALTAALSDALVKGTPLYVQMDEESRLPCSHYARINERRALPFDPPRNEEEKALVARYRALADHLNAHGEAPCVQWLFNTEDYRHFVVFINGETNEVVFCDEWPANVAASDLLG